MVDSLVAKYEQALGDKESLTEQISTLRNELDEKDHKLQLLEGELRTARIARGMSTNNEDSDLAKARISSLVREIDRCIALLNE